MAGLYLYCLRKKSPVRLWRIKAIKTIGSGEVYTLPFEELEAVVSEVDLGRFSSEEIQKKAQEDVNWIKEKAQIHEHVIEQAMGLPAGKAGVGKTIPVIPMRFGTIFKTKENLEEMISKHHAKFKKSLKSLGGKQEWGVKVYLNEEVFEKQIEKESSALAQKKKEIASLPRGIDFFAKKQVDEVIKKEKDRKLKRVLEGVFESLQKLAVKASQGKNLDKAITGREEPMVLNANFLIKEEEVGEFQRQADGLKAKYRGLGLMIQQSGPWPPYNFVS